MRSSSRAQGNAHLEQEVDEAAVQLDKDVWLPDDFSQSTGLGSRGTAPATHPSGESAAARQEAAASAVRGGRVGHGLLGRCVDGAADGGRVGGGALGLGFGELLDPAGKVAEGGRHDGKRLHGQALAVGAEGHEGVDALVAAGVDVGDAKDVGRGVPREGIPEEDGAPGHCGTGALGGDKGGGRGG